METEKFKDKTQYSGRFTPETKAVFNKIAAENTEFTGKEVVEYLCDFYQRNDSEHINLQLQLATAQKKVQFLENQLQELQEENATLADLAQSSADNSDAELQNLRAQVEEYEAQIGSITTAAAERESRLQSNYEKVQAIANANALELQKITLAAANPEKGKYLVEFNEPTNELLSVILNRLREKLNKPELSVNDLIVDLFVKYINRKFPTGISFPTMLTGEEIRMIIKKYE